MMSVDVAKLRIVMFPDPVLRRPARPVERIDETVRAVAKRMLDLMHEAKGAGLAAPQVGLDWRLFVAGHESRWDEQRHEGTEPRRHEGVADRVFINPRLTVTNPEMVAHEEGCLSLPGITAEIRRPAGASITARNLDGREFTLRSDAFPARVWQHEMDHLDGVLIIDRLSPIDRLATRKALKALQQK